MIIHAKEIALSQSQVNFLNELTDIFILNGFFNLFTHLQQRLTFSTPPNAAHTALLERRMGKMEIP